MPSWPMTWRLLEDLDEFAGAAEPMMAARPAGHTVELSILEMLRAGLPWSEDPPVYGLYTAADGTTSGAVLMTPPHNLVLAEIPTGSIGDLVGTLAAAGVAVPG